MIADEYGAETISFSEGLLLLNLDIESIQELISLKNTMHLRQKGVVNKIPAAEVFNVFLSACVRDGLDGRLAQGSRKTYIQVIEDLQKYCLRSDLPLEIEASEVPQYCLKFMAEISREKHFSARTWNKYAAIVRTFIFFLADSYSFSKDQVPSYRKYDRLIPQHFPEKEIPILYKIARQSRYPIRNHCLISFLLGTGVRRAELQNARLRDISFEEETLTVRKGKGGKGRIIDLPSRLVPTIERYLDIYGVCDPDNYLFGRVNSPENQWGAQSIDRVVHRLVSKMPSYQKDDPSFGYRCHTFRHTYAVSLLKKGIHLRVIADLLGHESMESTRIYTVLDTTERRIVAKSGLNYISELLED